MHEISIMTSILEIAAQEIKKHHARRLLALYVRYGVLSNVVADSMNFAFEALCRQENLEGVRLCLKEEPLKLKCPACGHIFAPQGRDFFYLPCPACRKSVSFTVLEGEGIFLDRIEAE